MKFFSPGDIYDNLLQTIQQFSMETYYYKRQTKKVDLVIDKYKNKLKKAMAKLPKKNEKSLERIKRRLTEMFENKKNLVEGLEESIKKHKLFFDKLNSLSNYSVSTNDILLRSKSPMVVKVNNESTDNRIYCSCGGKAYGNMIRCDEEECDIGWYHYKCIGILKTPKSPWKCSRCVGK
ncbi:Ing5 [Ecytonucleospora hepatopenaei]|uniref:Ing5 n=1 Tax=Ecytonucleospora hepatopenaei TaxID=646526 RepID=A0A1W0E8A5_9MICR|nr:Ing5 [Ecytonucleospora hepatopenaei]